MTSDYIKLFYDDFLETLDIEFINLNANVTGKYLAHFGYHTIMTEFEAQLKDFKWMQVFDVSKKNFGNRKLNKTFAPTRESRFNVYVDRYTPKRENIPDKFIKDLGTSALDLIDLHIKIRIPSFNYTPVKNQLAKISQLFLENLQSELKKKYSIIKL